LVILVELAFWEFYTKKKITWRIILEMQKKAETRKKYRRNSKAFIIGAIALISLTSMTFSPHSASAQTPLGIGSITQSITSPLAINSSGLIGGGTGALTDPGALVGGVTGAAGGVTGAVGGVTTGVVGGVTGAVGVVTGAVGGVVGQVGEVVQDPAEAVTEIIQDPTSAVGKFTDPLLNPPTKNSPGTNQSPTPTTGNNQSSKPVEQITDTLKDPTKVIDQVTDILEDPSQIGNKIKDTIVPGTGSNGEIPGAANINMMAKETLTGKLLKNGDKYKLFLEYSGTPAVGVKLLSKTYVFFHMPEEFTSLLASNDFKKAIKATYHVPVIGSSGPSAINAGTFADSAVKIDNATNSIVLVHSDSLSLSLNAPLNFSLSIDLEQLPASNDKVYTFVSTAYDKNIIKLDLLEAKGARVDIDVPDCNDNGNDPGKDNDGSTPSPGGGNNDAGGGNNGGGGGNNGAGGDSGGKGTGSSDGKSGSGTIADWLGHILPKTASNMWNIGLIGMILTMVGAALKFNRMKKLI
jgi:hypothetical protein